MLRLIWLLLVVIAGRCLAGEGVAADPVHFMGLDHFEAFKGSQGRKGRVQTSPWLAPPRPWNELVVSWNATAPRGTRLTVEARARRGGLTTRFYVLGVWMAGAGPQAGGSLEGQKDAFAEVKTDTLVCRKHMEQVQLRLTWGQRPETPEPEIGPARAGGSVGGTQGAGEGLKFLGVCTYDSLAPWPRLGTNRAAWGKAIEVPRRSQIAYAGQSGWCSPTALAMVLAHWGAVLGRPELDVPVPEVAAQVFDPGLEGTGNWVLNTAFAGRFEGMRAYVTRLGDVPEIEDWVEAGVPVIASVSFDLLNGRVRDEGNGHLIVVVGFTASGDVVANDPWPNPKKENSVRRIFPRANFLRAWQRSHHTVYLIHPLTVKPPPDRHGHWE